MSFIEITEFKNLYLHVMSAILIIYLVIECVIGGIRVVQKKPKEASYGVKRLMLVVVGGISLEMVAVFQPRWQIVFVFVGLAIFGLIMREVSKKIYINAYTKCLYIIAEEENIDVSKVEKPDTKEIEHWTPKWLYVLVAVAPFAILELIDKLNELGMLPWATAFIKWWFK